MTLDEMVKSYQENPQPEILEQICNDIRPFIQHTAYNLARKTNNPIAEDFEQEAFLHIIKHINMYDCSISCFITFIRIITRTRMIDCLRAYNHLKKHQIDRHKKYHQAKEYAQHKIAGRSPTASEIEQEYHRVSNSVTCDTFQAAQEYQRIPEFSSIYTHPAELTHPRTNQEDEVEKNDFFRHVCSCLNPIQAKLVDLYYRQGYNFPEIAELCNMTKTGVEKHVRSARSTLKLRLQREFA